MEVQILAADLTAVKPKALQAARDTNPRKIRVAFVPWLRSLALPLLATARS